jgi:tetratricopeptide (TPR) repeat protein
MSLIARIAATAVLAAGLISTQPGHAAGRDALHEVRELITASRELGESGSTRLLRQAQALLDSLPAAARNDAEALVLRATIAQYHHHFSAARHMLLQATRRAPHHAQAWLTLAAVERVTGRISQAAVACNAVANAGARLYAAACTAELQSLQGQYEQARNGYAALIPTVPDGAVRAWLLSLSAENEERAGDDTAAWRAYQASLELSANNYTTIAYADSLLRTGRPAAALSALAKQPQSDSVTLRRAAALRALGNPGWTIQRDALRRRMHTHTGDSEAEAAHGRELAMFHLWLKDDHARALKAAKLNWQVQRESIDAWLLLQAARATGDAREEQNALSSIRKTGLRDERFAVTKHRAMLPASATSSQP